MLSKLPEQPLQPLGQVQADDEQRMKQFGSFSAKKKEEKLIYVNVSCSYPERNHCCFSNIQYTKNTHSTSAPWSIERNIPCKTGLGRYGGLV